MLELVVNACIVLIDLDRISEVVLLVYYNLIVV